MPKRRTSKRACYECGDVSHFIADCPNKKKGKDKDEKKSKPFKKDKDKAYRKKYFDHAHIGEEWDSNSDFNSDDEGVITIAIRAPTPTKSLFDEMSDDDTPTCFMAKGRKYDEAQTAAEGPSHAQDDEETDDDEEIEEAESRSSENGNEDGSDDGGDDDFEEDNG
ncbi:histone deacetylase HDT2-like [Phragmites australis]|uniref:histone deacetylase HDT2-like n=1 Tax=Phragmites australis TaxID=29695 RepID=UPI002D769003|nr:histone deacetylase HDT2-like [Phragmites australis]